MTDILEFVSGLLEGMSLIAMALAIGGVVYMAFILRLRNETGLLQNLAGPCTATVSIFGAAGLACCQLGQLILKPWELVDATGGWAFEAFSQTQVFQFQTGGVLLAVALTLSLFWLRRAPKAGNRWIIMALIIAAFMMNEARLSHGASRLEGGGLLMVVTTLHMLGALVWAGGIVHLVFSWRAIRNIPEAIHLWPTLITRFSSVGLVSVACILIPGAYLGFRYVGTWSGLIGTGYGNMLLVKILLFLCVLMLAAINFLAGHAWKKSRQQPSLFSSVPVYIEVEIILAAALLFTAATLTSFPPAVDVPDETATTAEVWGMFDPKFPRLAGPELMMIDAPELTDLRTGKMGQRAYMSWDRFNHNISGVIVLTLSVMALMDWRGLFRWTRHWPALFVAFSVLIVVFANPDYWPLGPAGFVESLQNTTVVQHWLAGCVVFGLGWFEWRLRQGVGENRTKPFVFPALCIVGGILLLTHSHNISELKTEFLVQSTHVLMGLLGVIAGCGRWLELRLDSPYQRWAGLASITAIMLVGWILLFYVNPEQPQ